MTEAEWESTVVDMAHAFGWMVAGFRPARTEKGWRTPVRHEGKGWPDLFLCGRGRVLAVELKTDKGRLSLEQRQWIDALREAGIDARVWRPRDVDEAESTLRSNHAAR